MTKLNPPKELIRLLQLIEQMIQDPRVPEEYFKEVDPIMERLKERYNLP